MKIIVSHDVDHLYGTDHLKDLIYPKLWIRETLAILTGKINISEWSKRMISPFHRERNHIKELLDFDDAYGVKSTFFFGMANGLGMSYKAEKALPFIELVTKKGFTAGVHGINYTDSEAMKREFTRFASISGKYPSGIRMHYVRFNEDTFSKLADCGYLFDSTEFNKGKGTCLKAPYKIKTMWEFPLCIMDGYLPYKFEDAKARTLELLVLAQKEGLEYFTILFHDCMFCPAWEEKEKWYRWVIEYLSNNTKYAFVSYEKAITELENNERNHKIRK